MATNPLRDAVAAKYGGTETLPSQSTADSTKTLSTVRAAAVEKYGTPAPTTTTASDGTALVAPPATPTPEVSAGTSSVRAAAIAKYSSSPAATTPPVGEQTAQLPQETISKTQPQSLGDKVKSFLYNSFDSIVHGSQDQFDAAKALAGSIKDSNLVQIGTQLGYDKTTPITVPAGMDASKMDPTTKQFYQDQSIAARVKSEYPTLQKQYPDLPAIGKLAPDTQTVETNLSDYTKGLGLRNTPTLPELVGTMATLAVVPALIEAPVAVGLGAAGWTLLDKAERAVTGSSVSDVVANKIGASPSVRDALSLVEFLGKAAGFGAAYKNAPKAVEFFTKQTTEQYNLGRSVFIDAAKVKSIFQTGDKISPEELQLVKSLGLTTSQYTEATKNGVTIDVPPELLVTVADKPWFAKLKSALGMEPFSNTVIKTQGTTGFGAETRPSRLLEGGTATESVTGVTPQANENRPVPGGSSESLALPPAVKDVLTTPLTPKLLDRVKDFTPVEASAFGRSLVQTINDAIGTKLENNGQFAIPDNVKINTFEAPDGRPAQFNNAGQIEIFMPSLLKDLKVLADNGEIVAHEGEFTTVYKKEPNVSLEDLTVRYIKDILVHEKAHQKTMTFEDVTKANMFRDSITKARLSQNPAAVIKARQDLTAHMRTLEDKANAYMRDNRAALEKEIFGNPSVKRPNQFERQALGIPADTKFTLGERSLLKERIKALSKGSRIGFSEGKKVGVEQATTELKSKYETTLEKIRNRQESIEAKRKQLIDYAQLLPFRERGKFLKAINNTKSDKNFLDVLERMRKEARLSDRRALMGEISKELKATIVKKREGLPNAKYAYNEQKTLNQIRQTVKMPYAEAQVKIANTISDWQSAHPDEAFPADLLHQVEILKMAGVKDQSVEELTATLSAIQSIKETGLTKKELERFNRDTEIDRARAKIFDVITGGQKLPSESQAIKNRPQGEKSIGTNIKQFLTIHNSGLEELLDMMSKLDKGSKPYESFLSTYVTRKTDPAFSSEFHGEMGTIAGVSERIKAAYGLKGDKDVLLELGEMKKEHNLGDYKFADGTTKNLTLSRGEALQYYLWMQDPALESTFKEGMGWTPEVMKAVEDLLTPGDKKMAEQLLEFYREYYKGINDVFSKEFGVDLPFNENYSPVQRSIEVSIPENVLLAQESAKYATAKNGSLKDRTRNQIDLKPIDAFSNLTRHVTKMEHYKSWSDPMFSLRRIFGNKEVRQAITDFHGQDMMKAMDSLLNDMARGGVAREKVVRALDTLRSNVTKAMLGFDPRVGIKQLTAMTNYGIEIPTGDFFGGMARYWKNPVEWSKFLHDNSDAFRERFAEGYERDVKFAIEKGYDKRLSNAKNISELMFIPIRAADKLTVYAGSTAAFLSKYKEITGHSFQFGKEMDEAAVRESIRFAEDVTNRVQESSRLDTLSPLQRQGSWGKMFTMFQNQPAKYIRIMTNVVRNYRAGRTDFQTAMHRFVWVWIIVPFLYNLVADQFVDPKYRESGGGLVMRTLLGPLSYPLIAGQMFQSIYGWTTGDQFGYQASPMESFMNDIQNSIGQFQRKSFDGAAATKGTTYILDALGKLTGVPSTIVTKPVRNALKNNQ